MITAAFIIAEALGITCSWWWVIAAFAGDYALTDNISSKNQIPSDNDY